MFFVIALLAFLFRLPYFVNAAEMQSDHAIVGLQALHILKGEFQWFLWGCNYQASFEPILTAIVFLGFGPSFQGVLSISYCAFILCCFMTYDTIKRSVGRGGSLFLCLVLVFASFVFMETTLRPPRQWCYVFALLPVWLIDRAPGKNGKLFLVLAGFFSFFSLYIDFYAIQFLVPLIWFGLTSIRSGTAKNRIRYWVLGLAMGAVFLAMTRFLGPTAGAPLAFSPVRFYENGKLFFATALPMILGWNSKWWGVGAISTLVVVGLVFYESLRIIKNRHRTAIDNIGLFGTLTILSSSLGFLGSSMASGPWAARYLSPIIFALPFGLAPAFVRLGLKRLMLLVVPSMIVATSDSIQAISPRIASYRILKTGLGDTSSDLKVMEYLRSQGVIGATAEYFSAYRLTLLSLENPVVVPREPQLDRFRPYREFESRAGVVAQLIGDDEPNEIVKEIEGRLQREKRSYDKKQVGGYLILLTGKDKILMSKIN